MSLELITLLHQPPEWLGLQTYTTRYGMICSSNVEVQDKGKSKAHEQQRTSVWVVFAKNSQHLARHLGCSEHWKYLLEELEKKHFPPRLCCVAVKG